MPQTLLFPADTTDKGAIIDAGANAGGGLSIDNKPVCLLGSKATHPQGPDVLLFASAGITLDGVPLALSGGGTALGAQQLPSAVDISVEAGSTFAGNVNVPRIVGSPIEKYNNDELVSTLAHDAFLKFASNTDEYFFCWYLISIFGTAPGIDAYRKLYKEAKDGSLKNPPVYTIVNPIVKYAGFSWLHLCIFVNRDFVLHAAQTLPDEEPDTAEEDNEAYDKSIWLSRVRLAAALVEEYGEYIYRYLWKLAGKDPQSAGYDAGATYAFAILDSIMPQQHQMKILKGTVKGTDVDIQLSFAWWHKHIEEIKSANESAQSRALDDEVKLENGDTIKKFGEGDGDIKKFRYHHGGIQNSALKNIFDDKVIPKIYYGNWLRDVSQALDRLLLGLFGSAAKSFWIWMMRFTGRSAFVMEPLKKDTEEIIESLGNPALILFTDDYWEKVGKAKKYYHYKFFFWNAMKELDKEFGAVKTHIGCYRSEEHIDNPYEISTATASLLQHADLQTDNNLENMRGCKLLHLNYEWGMKNYIRDGVDAYSTVGKGPTITAVAFITAKLKQAVALGNSIEGRIAFGAALHTLQDYYAHSNYCEILMLMHNQHNVFPWVDTHRDSIPEDFEIKNPYDIEEAHPSPVTEYKWFVLAFFIDKYETHWASQKRAKNTDGKYAEMMSRYFTPTSYTGQSSAYPAVVYAQADRFEAYQQGVDYDWSNKPDTNTYPEEWQNTTNAYAFALNLPEVQAGHWRVHILQDLRVYSNGGGLFNIYDPKVSVPALLPKYRPDTMRSLKILQTTPIYPYKPHRIPVVTGRFGKLDTAHSVTDLITEKLTPASLTDVLLDKLLDTVGELVEDLIKDAKKEVAPSEGMTQKVKLIENLFTPPKDADPNAEMSFEYSEMIVEIGKFIQGTGGTMGRKERNGINKTIKNALDVEKENNELLRKACGEMLKMLTQLSVLNLKQLKKLSKSILKVKNLRTLLTKYALSLVPVMLGYIVAGFTKALSQLVEDFQNHMNEISKKAGYLIEKDTVYSYGLFTNPTHSQLAKDDYHKPFHKLAGQLAIFATKEVAGRMDLCWKNQGVTASEIIEVALQFITHPLDQRNQFMIGKYGMSETIVKPWIVDNHDRIAEASKPAVSQWIVGGAIEFLKLREEARAVIGKMQENIVKAMKMVDSKIDELENAYEELERKAKEGMKQLEKNMEQMKKNGIENLNKIIDQLTIEMNKKLVEIDQNSQLPSMRQHSRSSAAEKYLNNIEYCKREKAALENLDIPRHLVVLDKWYARKYKVNKEHADKQEDFLFA